MTFKPDHLIFLGIKAAGLEPDSWLIEMGLAWITDDTVHTWSSLIRSQHGWDPDALSDHSTMIHNIPREELDAAPRATDVAYDLLEWIAAHHVINDRSRFDRRLMEHLFDTISFVPPAFFCFDLVVDLACHGNVGVLKGVLARLEEAPRPHRAGADATRLADAILYGIKMGRLSHRTSG